MGEEKKDEGEGYPIKIFLEEALEKQRNVMMDKFSQILQRLPTDGTPSSSSHSGGATPFKVQVNLDIPIFKGQIDANIVDIWLNLLEGCFRFMTFLIGKRLLLHFSKLAPYVKDWWETYCEKKDEGGPSLFSVVPTWNYF